MWYLYFKNIQYGIYIMSCAILVFQLIKTHHVKSIEINTLTLIIKIIHNEIKTSITLNIFKLHISHKKNCKVQVTLSLSKINKLFTIL